MTRHMFTVVYAAGSCPMLKSPALDQKEILVYLVSVHFHEVYYRGGFGFWCTQKH